MNSILRNRLGLQAAAINRRLLLRSTPLRRYPLLRHAVIPAVALIAGLFIGHAEWFDGLGDVFGEPTARSVVPREPVAMTLQTAVSGAPAVSSSSIAPDLPAVQALGLLKPTDNLAPQSTEALPAAPDTSPSLSQPNAADAAFLRRDGPPLPMTGSLDMGNQRIAAVAVEPKPQASPAASARSASGPVSVSAKPVAAPTPAPVAKAAPKPAPTAKPAIAKPAAPDPKAKPRDPCAEALRGRTSIATSDLGVRSLLPGKLVFMVGDHTCTLSAGTQLGDEKVSRIDAERLRIETSRGAIQLLDQ